MYSRFFHTLLSDIYSFVRYFKIVDCAYMTQDHVVVGVHSTFFIFRVWVLQYLVR